MFDNRIEIISPGHLPNNLTVAKIRAGNSNIRNPILVSYMAKGLLPYHGLGFGINWALNVWPDIDFTDDRDSCLFTATVRRKQVEGSGVSAEIDEGVKKTTGKATGKTPDLILLLLSKNSAASIPELAEKTEKSERAVERAIRKLREEGRIRRIGPAKGGHWEVVK